MKIFVDTNCLYENYKLAKPSIRRLFRGSDLANFEILFPSVIKDEIQSLAKRDIEEYVSKIQKMKRSIDYNFPFDLELGIADDISYNLTERYQEYLNDRLNEYESLNLLSVENVQHQSILNIIFQTREVDHFKEINYKDLLAWFTVKEQIENEDQLVIISNDSHFFKGDTLRPYLEETLGIDIDFKGYHEISEFNQEHITDNIAQIEEVDVQEIDRSNFNELPGLDIKSRLIELINEYTIDFHSVHGFSPDYESPNIWSTSIVDYSFDSGIEIDNEDDPSDYILSGSIQFESLVYFTVYRANYHTYSEERAPYVTDWEHNDNYVACEEDFVFEAQLKARFINREGTYEISSIELDDIVIE